MPTASSAASTGNFWTVYHGDARGSGVTTNLRSIITSAPRWRSPVLDGALYGEPLVWSKFVYVATENDTVYALNASNGTVAWSRHLARAVPASALPCGNIAPTVGITGTPVIDRARNELFVVADEYLHGRAVHEFVGLDATSGTVKTTTVVDPPGASAAALLQRTGLALVAGRVVFGFSGNYGDCSPYRGRVVSVTEDTTRATFFTIDRAANNSQGGIWMGGAAPVVSAGGHIWVSVGNGSVQSTGQPFDDSDSVLELSPALRLEQFFAPNSWSQDNAQDLDLPMAPALLANGRVVIAGKSRIAYLLTASHLGGIGGDQTSLGPVCTEDVAGGSAIVASTVYLPCLSGPVALSVSASGSALNVLWAASEGGGPPILAAGLVWTIGQDGVLYGLDSATGSVRQRTTLGTMANHFPTPSVGDGLMLAATSNQVVAFRATY